MLNELNQRRTFGGGIIEVRFKYEKVDGWPRLAWAARIQRGSDLVRVLHGPWVETKDSWFCEAAWDGAFAEGGFDQTDIIAGSGGRIRGQALRFLSSGSNLDRLHSFLDSEGFLVSNSYACLLAVAGARADPCFREYADRIETYRFAFFGEYARELPSSMGPVRLTYFADLEWDGNTLFERAKPHADRSFKDFGDYRSFLQRTMAGITMNARDPARFQPFEVLCPISKGYDSPTLAVLAREVTPLTTFTFPKDRKGLDDSGEQMASRLDLPCEVVEREAYRETQLPEIPFIAGSAGVGDIAFKAAEHLLQGKLLFNGVGAVPLWVRRRMPPGPELAVGDGALLGLTEFRLWSGFLNCSVPCWGVRQISDIQAISQSAEMAEWDIGGNYNKPICRRIIEESGIPRGTFATGKSGVSHVYEARRDFLLPASRQDFMEWLERTWQELRQPGVDFPHPTAARLLDGLTAPTSYTIAAVLRATSGNDLARFLIWRRPLAAARRKLREPHYHHRLLFHWAVDHMVARYGTPHSRGSIPDANQTRPPDAATGRDS